MPQDLHRPSWRPRLSARLRLGGLPEYDAPGSSAGPARRRRGRGRGLDNTGDDEAWLDTDDPGCQTAIRFAGRLSEKGFGRD